MSTSKPATAREALLAELLGDVQVLLDRVDKTRLDLQTVDKSAKLTADTIKEATAQYRSQVDDLVARLRKETAAIITQTTEHAAKSLVGQQTAVLEKAASTAIENALKTKGARRSRSEWLLAAAISGTAGGLTGAFVLLLAS